MVNYSIQLQIGEYLLVEVEGHHTALAKAILVEAFKVGGNASIVFNDQDILRTQIMYRTTDQWIQHASHDNARMNAIDAYVLIKACQRSNKIPVKVGGRFV
ncbi:hypothetical protein FE783_34420 [Paenibacillus mesophilus]|nr:hypothetical protein FE783_34420 [Paenibacillus mesophilus]